MSWLSTIETVALEETSLLLSFSILDLSHADQLVSIWEFDGVSLGVLELCGACLCLSSSLSKSSGTAQVYRDWCIVKVSGCVRGVVSLEVVLVIPLLFLLWNKSSHLIVISFPKDLIDGFLGYDTVDSSLF